MRSEIQEEMTFKFPRIRDLPEHERIPFRQWLCGQTMPWIDSIDASGQDFYYPWDYERFKKGLKVID